MKKLFAIGISLLVMMSCKTKSSTEDTSTPRELFRNSVILISEITEEISLSQDSLSADSIFYNFDKKIGDLNLQYPPLTDLKLTEQENDSLSVLINKMKEVRDIKLKEFYDASNATLLMDRVAE